MQLHQYIILYYIILYYIILYSITLYYFILYYNTLYYTILYHIISYHIILYYIILYYYIIYQATSNLATVYASSGDFEEAVATAQAREEVAPPLRYQFTRLVSNSAPTWSSRCCFTACHFEFGKSLGRNALRIDPNWK